MSSAADQSQIEQELRVLREQASAAEEQYKKVAPELSRMAALVATQERILVERQQVQEELEYQKSLEHQIVSRLEQLKDVSPPPFSACTVLRAASSGVQVEPKLKPALISGGVIGFTSTFLLALLLFLVSMAPRVNE